MNISDKQEKDSIHVKVQQELVVKAAHKEELITTISKQEQLIARVQVEELKNNEHSKNEIQAAQIEFKNSAFFQQTAQHLKGGNAHDTHF